MLRTAKRIKATSIKKTINLSEYLYIFKAMQHTINQLQGEVHEAVEHNKIDREAIHYMLQKLKVHSDMLELTIMDELLKLEDIE